MQVPQLIRDQLEEIAAEWASQTRRLAHVDGAAPPRAVQDHVPALLGDLAAWLEGQDGHEVEALASEDAERYAMDRFDRNFDFGEVLDEYRILRRVLLHRVTSALGDLGWLDEITRLNEGVDMIAAAAAVRFMRAREEQRMREADRARLAVEAGEIGTWEWWPRSGAMIWDERCREIFGVSAVPVSYELFLGLAHPDDRVRVAQQVERNVEREDTYRIEFRILRRSDAALRWVEARGHVLSRDSGGRAERFMGTVVDVTRRHEADEFRERFIGIVSHDLRSPLATVRISAGAILCAEHLREEVVKNVRRIEFNVARMERMISDLLDLTRGRLGGGIPIARSACNVDTIASRVIESAQAAHPDRRILKETSGTLDGQWDSERIAQLLDNLLGNAMKHGNPDQPVRVALRGGEDEVTVVVHNGGAPIDPQLMPYLFDAFRRGGAGGGAATPDGLGLGLYIAREIVRAHAGRIAASSSAQGGTTFTVTLPR